MDELMEGWMNELTNEWCEWMKDIGEVYLLMMRTVLVKYFQNV